MRTLLLLLVFFLGCTPSALQIQAQTANAIAGAANASLPALVDAERREGLDAIDTVAKSGGSVDQGRAAIVHVKDEWAPFWTAWTGLRVAMEAWATTLEAGKPSSTLDALTTSYCNLIAAWPKQVPALPIAPVACGAKP